MLTKSATVKYTDPGTPLTIAHNKINAVIIDDLNKDGFTDLVLWPSNYVYAVSLDPIVWVNQKGTSFVADAKSVIKNASPYQFFRDMVQGDFNQDGYTDYFLVDQGWELNNRDPSTFVGATPALLRGTATGVEWVTADKFVQASDGGKTFNHIGDTADYDGDGDLDIVIAAMTPNQKYQSRIYKNDGAGNFTLQEGAFPKYDIDPSGATFIKLGGQYSIAVGFLRMWDANSPVPQAPTILGQKNGVFTESFRLDKPNLGSGRERNYNAEDMFNQDVNGDGLEDLLIMWATETSQGVQEGLSNLSGKGNESRYTDISNNLVTVYLQTADGKLKSTGDVYSLQGIGSAFQLFFADFNRDGHIDFWNTAYGIHPGRVDKLVWLNDGTGKFANPTTTMFQLPGNFNSASNTSPYFFDANNDGVIDVVTTNFTMAPEGGKSTGQILNLYLSPTPVKTDTPTITVSTTTTTTTPTVTVATDTVVTTTAPVTATTPATTTPVTTTPVTTTPAVDPIVVKAAVTTTKVDDQVVRLYDAALDRVPDVGGLEYWVGQMQSGMPLSTVAGHFIASPEFASLYGANPGNEQFVTLLYNNVLDRTPDTAGLNWWTGQIQSGAHTRTSALLGFSESAENIAKFETLALIGVDTLVPGGG